MVSRFFKLLVVQFLWTLSYAFVAAVSYGKFSEVPEWHKTIFLVTFGYSCYLLLVIREDLTGDESVQRAKILWVSSIALIFMIDMVARYFINGSF